MAEILVRIHVDIWNSPRPEAYWAKIDHQSKGTIYFEALKKVNGKAVKVLKPMKRSWLGHARHDRPGVADFCYIQDDREPIQGSLPYNMAVIEIMDGIQEEMLRAARNVREIQEALYAVAP